MGKLGQSGDRRIYNPKKKVYISPVSPPLPPYPQPVSVSVSETSVQELPQVPPDILKQFNEVLGGMIDACKNSLRQQYGEQAIKAIDTLVIVEMDLGEGATLAVRYDIESIPGSESAHARKSVNMCAGYVEACSR